MGIDLSESVDQKEYSERRTFVRAVETLYYDLHDRRGQIYQDTPRVIKGDEIPFRGGMQMWNKNLVHPGMDHPWTQSLHIHVKEMVPEAKSQRHYHQNEAVMYILNGQGYEIFDGEKYEWNAGDIVTIPGGCVHQHFAAEDSDPPRVLISKPKPLCLFLNLHFQQQIELPSKEPMPGWEDHDPNENTRFERKEMLADGHGLPIPDDWDPSDVLSDRHSIQHGHNHDHDHDHDHDDDHDHHHH